MDVKQKSILTASQDISKELWIMFLKMCLFFLLIWNYDLSEHLTLFPVLVTGTNGFIYIILNPYIKRSLKQIFSWGVTRSSSCVRGQDQNLQRMAVAIKMLASLNGLGCQLLPRRQGFLLQNGVSLRKCFDREELAVKVVKERVESRRAL